MHSTLSLYLTIYLSRILSSHAGEHQRRLLQIPLERVREVGARRAVDDAVIAAEARVHQCDGHDRALGVETRQGLCRGKSEEVKGKQGNEIEPRAECENGFRNVREQIRNR